MICERCGSESMSQSMSYFDTAMLCPGCQRKERAHPKFEEARAAEIAECKRGNFSFPGIGKPSDL